MLPQLEQIFGVRLKPFECDGLLVLWLTIPPSASLIWNHVQDICCYLHTDGWALLYLCVCKCLKLRTSVSLLIPRHVVQRQLGHACADITGHLFCPLVDPFSVSVTATPLFVVRRPFWVPYGDGLKESLHGRMGTRGPCLGMLPLGVRAPIDGTWFLVVEVERWKRKLLRTLLDSEARELQWYLL